MNRFVRCGRENEVIWKLALDDKDEQIESVDKWLKLSSDIANLCDYEDNFIIGRSTLMNDLSISRGENIDIWPATRGESMSDSDGVIDISDLNAIDASILEESSNREVTSKVSSGPQNEVTTEVSCHDDSTLYDLKVPPAMRDTSMIATSESSVKTYDLGHDAVDENVRLGPKKRFNPFSVTTNGDGLFMPNRDDVGSSC